MNELIKEIIIRYKDKSELSFEYDGRDFLVQELDPNTLQYSSGKELSVKKSLELIHYKVKIGC